MDPQSLVIVLRMAERIIGVIIGGLLIYWGYRLFLSLPGKRGRDGGTGDFALAGGTKLKLSKVGPGVFFALFGTALIVFSLTRSVSLTTTGPANAAAPAAKASDGKEPPAVVGTTTVKFIGATGVPETEEERTRRRAEVQQDIIALNRSVDRATGADRTALEHAVIGAKVALMEPLWAEDWGDLADFRDWLEKGGNPPAGSQPAVDVFQKR
jgi:hypothetical protein